MENTILVVKDESGWVFGGYCTEYWHEAHRFFGNGDNFLFSFGKEQEPKIFRWQGDSEQHMYADARSIGLGGSRNKGRFALSI